MMHSERIINWPAVGAEAKNGTEADETARCAALGRTTLMLLGRGLCHNPTFQTEVGYAYARCIQSGHRIWESGKAVSRKDRDNLHFADALLKLPQYLIGDMPREDLFQDRSIWADTIVNFLVGTALYADEGSPLPNLKTVQPFLRRLYPPSRGSRARASSLLQPGAVERYRAFRQLADRFVKRKSFAAFRYLDIDNAADYTVGLVSHMQELNSLLKETSDCKRGMSIY